MWTEAVDVLHKKGSLVRISARINQLSTQNTAPHKQPTGGSAAATGLYRCIAMGVTIETTNREEGEGFRE